MPVEQNKMAAICEPARCLAADPKRKLSLCMYEASKDDLIVTDLKVGHSSEETRRRCYLNCAICRQGTVVRAWTVFRKLGRTAVC